MVKLKVLARPLQISTTVVPEGVLAEEKLSSIRQVPYHHNRHKRTSLRMEL